MARAASPRGLVNATAVAVDEETSAPEVRPGSGGRGRGRGRVHASGAKARSAGEHRLGWYLAGPALAVMVAVTAYPLGRAVWLSLHRYRLTDPANRGWVGLKNYGVTLTDGLWWQCVWTTVVITPDTWIGLIIPYMSFTLPLSIWTLSAFFREIPWEMEQAAQVDGATPWQAFRKVIVPLAAPGVFTAALLTFFFAWNDFVFGISLTATNDARPVPAALAFFTGQSFFQQPTAAISAAAVVVTIPVVVVVLLFQRKIVAGLTSGAVKG